MNRRSTPRRRRPLRNDASAIAGAAAIVYAALAAAGCGQKGPLVRPGGMPASGGPVAPAPPQRQTQRNAGESDESDESDERAAADAADDPTDGG